MQLMEILWWVFVAAFAVQMFFWLIVFGRLVFFSKKNSNSDETPGVSVVISAKNEYLRLKKNLPLILNQDYPNFEVIVVNHASVDETEYFLKEMSMQFPQLKSVYVQDEINFFHGKKFPLSVGIKSAKNEIVLLTDADCIPNSSQWIKNMAAAYKPETEIVLGYGGYEYQKGFLNKLIRFDTFKVALLYFSFAKWGLPYMGVGRNLSYKKSLFYKQGGFMSHYKVTSGDDDLFVNKAANSKNTKIVFDSESKTISAPKTSFADWTYQKRRHLTTGVKYKFKHLLGLGLWDISNLLFYILFIILIINKLNIFYLIGFFAFKTLISLIVLKSFSKKVDEKKLILLSPLYEVVILLITPFLTILNGLLKQRKWK